MVAICGQPGVADVGEAVEHTVLVAGGGGVDSGPTLAGYCAAHGPGAGGMELLNGINEVGAL